MINHMTSYINIFIFIFFFSIKATASDFKEESDKLYSFLDKLLIQNLIEDQNTKIHSKYKFMDGVENINFFEQERIYLNYDGLSSGGIWSKPGAKNFGGERVGTFYFNDGPVEAFVVAHVELQGKRNYFYVLIDNENKDEGWVGRPYIMSDKEGKKFLMPNPITGEMVREVVDIKFDITAIREIMVEEPVYYQRYVPTFNSIPWHLCGCSASNDFHEQGYRLYLNALEDGKRQVDTIVNNYLIYNNIY